MDPITWFLVAVVVASILLGVVMGLMMQGAADFQRGPAEFERPRVGEAESIPFARGTVDIRDPQVLYVGKAEPVPVRVKP